MNIYKKLKTANQVLSEKGWSGIGDKIKFIRYSRRETRNYPKWIKANTLTDQDRQKIKSDIADFSHKSLISVILPVYNVEEKWLRICLESVLKQLYENWELCIADDKSPSPHIRKILEEYAAKDKRIKVVFRAENGHISAASNSALEIATGEFCALLDHDDELSEDALFYLAKELNDFPETAMIYSDEDMIDERGRRYAPKFKPDFSLDLFYSLNLITHLSAYRTDILRKINGFRKGLEGSQDYDLALRFIEQIDEKQIRHIPQILYHWRAIRGSVALSSDEKPYAHERARQAIRDHLERTEKKAAVSQTIDNFHRVRYELAANPPKVSLILTADSGIQDLDKSSKIFTENTDYPNFEIIKISNNNAENLNRAVLQSDGEILCFVDADLCPLSKDWLEELTGFAAQKEIGAVGAKIISKNGAILHAGLIIGFDGLVGFAHYRLPSEILGNFGRAQVINNFSAVSISCLAVRRELFDEIGGFDAGNLQNSLFDADFCLKLRERNLRIVFTPYAELIETTKNSINLKSDADESDFFRQKWQKVIERDPFYNPNLSQTDETFTIKI